MRLRPHIIAAAAASLLAPRALAQASEAPTSPVGVWRGTSLCLVRPSPCNDEIVVYRVTPMNAADSLSVDARKVVNGQEEAMGVLGCSLAAPGAHFTFRCTIPRGTFRFAVRRDSLVGELRLPDDTKFRDIRTARVR
jgi:hypothetical protein